MNQIFDNDPSLNRKKQNKNDVVNETVIDLEFKFRLNVMMTEFQSSNCRTFHMYAINSMRRTYSTARSSHVR